MLTKDETVSTKNSEDINMQEGPPKDSLEVGKVVPKVEPDEPNTGLQLLYSRLNLENLRLNLKVNTHSSPTWGGS